MAPIKLPNIYRYITDKRIWVGVICLIIVIAIGLKTLDLYKSIIQKQRLDKERQKIAKDIEFWQNTTQKYPDYRDAYFQLAILEYKIKNIDLAKKYVQKALELDPNFEAGEKLESVLKNY